MIYKATERAFIPLWYGINILFAKNFICRKIISDCTIFLLYRLYITDQQLFIVALPYEGEKVHITVETIKYTNIEIVDSTQSEYRCWPSSPDEDAFLEFGRAAPIPSDSAPEPPTPNNNSINNLAKMVTLKQPHMGPRWLWAILLPGK